MREKVIETLRRKDVVIALSILLVVSLGVLISLYEYIIWREAGPWPTRAPPSFELAVENKGEYYKVMVVHRTKSVGINIDDEFLIDHFACELKEIKNNWTTIIFYQNVSEMMDSCNSPIYFVDSDNDSHISVYDFFVINKTLIENKGDVYFYIYFLPETCVTINWSGCIRLH